MNFIKNHLLLIISAIAVVFLVSGAYIFGILCLGNFCINDTNKKAAFQINKLVSNPQTKAMVDNLEMKDPKYAQGSSINFQLRVINISDKSISDITVKDIFPQFIDFDKGSGNFDLKTKILTLNTSLKQKEVKVFNFSGKVSKNLTFSQDILCVTNQVNATAKQGASASDKAQFCLEKKATAIGKNSNRLASTPATGAASLTLFFLIPAGILGWNLRKYSLKGNKFNN